MATVNETEITGGKLKSDNKNNISASILNNSQDSHQLSMKELVAMRRENKRLEEESQLTFKPSIGGKIPSSNVRRPEVSSDLSSRFDRLYSDAMKRQQSLQKLVDPVTADLTFTPKITSRAASRGRNNSGNGRNPSPLASSVASHASDRLYKAHRASATATPSVDPEETFHPKISKRASSTDRNLGGRPASERLFQQGQVHEEKLIKLRETIQARLAEECTFSPQLASVAAGNGRSDSDRDVTQRLLNYEESRRAKLEEARRRQEHELALHTTFRPALSQSPRPTSAGGTSGSREPVFQRLSRTPDRLKYQPLTIATNGNNGDKRGSTPVNGQSTQTRTASDSYGTSHVFERLAAESIRYQERVRSLEQARGLHELEQCTFRPLIPGGGDAARAASADRSISAQPVYLRLSEAAERQREEAKLRLELKQRLEMEGATFAPNLPARSAALGHSHGEDNGRAPVYDRLSKDAERQRVELKLREEQRLRAELEGVTFAPTLPASTVSLSKSHIKAHDSDSAASSTVFARLADEANRLRAEQQRRAEHRTGGAVKGKDTTKVSSKQSLLHTHKPASASELTNSLLHKHANTLTATASTSNSAALTTATVPKGRKNAKMKPVNGSPPLADFDQPFVLRGKKEVSVSSHVSGEISFENGHETAATSSYTQVDGDGEALAAAYASLDISQVKLDVQALSELGAPTGAAAPKENSIF